MESLVATLKVRHRQLAEPQQQIVMFALSLPYNLKIHCNLLYCVFIYVLHYYFHIIVKIVFLGNQGF